MLSAGYLLVICLVLQLDSAFSIHRQAILRHKFQFHRILQAVPEMTDHPNNPTGPDMYINEHYLTPVETLTPKIVNTIAKETGQDATGNLIMERNSEVLGGNGGSASNLINPSNLLGSISNIPAVSGITDNSGVDFANNADPGPLKSSIPSQATSFQPVTSVIENNFVPLVRPISINPNIIESLNQDENNNGMVFKPANIDELLNYSKDFNQGLKKFKSYGVQYQNVSQIISVQVNSVTSTTIVNTYRVICRMENGSYTKVTFSVNPSTLVVTLQESLKTFNIPSTVVSPENSEVKSIDEILRTSYHDYLVNAELLSSNQTILNNSASILFLRYNSSSSLYEVIVRNNKQTFGVLNFQLVKGDWVWNRNFTELPQKYWNASQQSLSASRVILDFATKRSNKTMKTLKKITIMPESTSKLVFCNYYLIDNTSTKICASLNLTSRLPTVEYYKQGELNASPSEFTQYDLYDVINKQSFRKMDSNARSLYKEIRGVPIAKVQLRETSGGYAYNVIYIGAIQQNIQVGYSPPQF